MDALDHLLADKTAKYTFTKQYEGVDYQVTAYDLTVGTESVLDMNCEFREPCIPVEVGETITTELLLIQSQPELTLTDWGTVKHLRKSEDKRT